MKLFYISLLFWLPLAGRSQMPIQVVTKVIEKEIAYTDGQPVHINAQKADVILKGWNRPTISIKLRLVAKHPDRAVAEREVTYHQYSLQASNGVIDLSNHFVIPQQTGRLKSQLKAIYEVSLPTKTLLTITNSFGDIRLSDLTSDINLKFEFGKLTLDDIGGKLTITSDYGDINGHNVDASLTLKAEKAAIMLRELSGTVNLQTHYGNLTLAPTTTLDALKIEADRTEILVLTKRIADFQYDVITSFADVRVSDPLVDQLSKRGNKQIFNYQPPGRKSEIVIRDSYSNIIIQAEKPFVDK